MSTTDEASLARSGEPLEQLSERIAERVAAERVPTVRAFAKAYTHRLSPDDLADLTVDELLEQVLAVFELADGRRSDEVAVRVFDPSLGEQGYQALGTVVDIATQDSPFLFDSVNEELEAREFAIRRVIHPVIGVVRGADGRIERVVPVREAEVRESVMHFEVDRRLSKRDASDLQERITAILGDVHFVVRDFQPMRDRAGRMIEIARAGSVLYGADEVAETVAFLEWLLDLNFVFLGYREYDLVDLPGGRALAAAAGSGLGILSKPGWSAYEEPVLLDSIEPALRARIEGGDLLIYSKTNRLSTVHRRARMDYIGVRRVSPDGRIVGEARMVGLFTSKAYMEPASKTPVLHRKLHQILDAEDLIEGSHDYKTVVSIFESFPKDELFAASVEELRTQVMGLLALQEQQHVRLFVRRDLYGRSVSLLVALPRDRFNADVRRKLQDLFLARFAGSSIDYHLSITESGLAQIHFTVHIAKGEIPDVAFDALEREVAEIARTWDDRLFARLGELHGDLGRGLFERWAPRFPDYYKSSTGVDLGPRTSSGSRSSKKATSRSSSGSRTRPTRARPSPESVCTRSGARSSCRTSCRSSRPSVCGSSRSGPRTSWAGTKSCSCTTSASWAPMGSRSTWRRAALASPRASPPCGEPSVNPTR